MSTDNHDPPRTPVRVAALPQPGEDVWCPSQQDEPHHPAANGLVERMHRALKAAIMCHAEKWNAALPLVLLGIRTAYEDLQSTAAQLVYGEPLRVPGEFLLPAAPKVEASTLIQQLSHHMDQLRQTPAARHASPATLIHKDLRDSTNVFLRWDTTRRALEPPYSGPHKVIACTDKTLTIVVRGWQVSVSGPSKTSLHTRWDSTRHRQPTSHPGKPVTMTRPPKTRRSGRTVRFPARFTA